MANPRKQICKLQEFAAHGANISCLALGQKSGLVLATGGSDNIVKLWKVDSETCFMSLCGHVNPIECVQFDPSEYLVGAGSQTGGLKVWDLTKGKKVKTFSGHKLAVTKLDFFPFSSSTYFVTGSKDTNIKLWDYRYSYCIGMYKGHEASISSLKYSPDGLWIASGDEKGDVKIWDLRVGRMIHVFNNLHMGAVTSIQFHPLVFLLASSGTDNKINILDLERFSVISQINTEKSTIRCLQFSDKGDILYGSGNDFLGVYGVEPTRVCDSVDIKWGNVNEFVVKDNRIVGASHLSTDVSTWLINLPEDYPYKNQFSPPEKPLKTNTTFSRDTGVRKSFNKQKSREMIKPKTDMNLIDENEIDNDDDNQTVITNVHDYHSVFKPNRTLNRSPPLLSENDNTSSIFSLEDTSQGILMHNNNSETETTSSIESTPCDSLPLFQSDTTGSSYFSPSTPQTPEIIEQSEKRHHPFITSSISMRSVSSNAVNENISKRPSSLPVFRQNDHYAYGNKYTSPQSQRKILTDEILSTQRHIRLLDDDSIITEQKKTTRTMPMDDYNELKHNLNNINFDEEDILESLLKNHKSTMGILKERHRNLNIIQTLWTNKNFKSAINSAVSMNDDVVISDLISIIAERPNLWCLDVCTMLLPSISNLIQSGNERFIHVSFKAIRDILQYFMPVIKNNIQRPPSAIGVDIMQEERYNKCRKCHSILINIRSFVLKRQTVQGTLGNIFRQLHMLLQTIDI